MQHNEQELNETTDLAENILPVEVWDMVFSNFGKSELLAQEKYHPCRLFWQLAHEKLPLIKGPLDYRKPLHKQQIEMKDIDYNAQSCCIAMDDHHIALATGNMLYIIATQTGEVIKELAILPSSELVTELVKLSSNLLAYVSKNLRKVYVWDIEKGQCIKQSSGDYCIDAIVLTNDGRLIMHTNQGVLLWDTSHDLYSPLSRYGTLGNHLECLLSNYGSTTIAFTHLSEGSYKPENKYFYLFTVIQNDNGLSLSHTNIITMKEGLSYCLVSDTKIAVMNNRHVRVYEQGNNTPVAQSPFWPEELEQPKMLSLGDGLIAAYFPIKGFVRIHNTANLNTGPTQIPVLKESDMVSMPDGSLVFINRSALCKLDFDEKKITLDEKATLDSFPKICKFQRF